MLPALLTLLPEVESMMLMKLYQKHDANLFANEVDESPGNTFPLIFWANHAHVHPPGVYLPLRNT